MPSNPDNLEIVQVEKQESAGLGGDPNDEAPYSTPINPLEDMPEVAGISFVEAGDTRPIRTRAIWPDGNNLRFRDVNNPGSGVTLTELAASAGGGITEPQHDVLDDLVHWLAETNYQEVTRSAGKVTNVTNWTDSGKTIKVREMVITRSAGKVSQMDFIQYDAAGVEKQRMTGVITRDGNGKMSSIQWTETGS
jgi:hypothetical protein